MKHLDHDTEHGETTTETVEEMGTHSEESVIILGFPYDETAELEIITTEKEPQTILTTGPLDDKPPTSPSEKTSGTLMDTNSIINPALRKWVSSSPNISSKKRFSPAEGWRCTGCDELASKVKKLEETVAKLVAEKPSILNPSQFTEMTDPKTPPKSKSVTKKTIWHSAKKVHTPNSNLMEHIVVSSVIHLIVTNMSLEIAFGEEDVVFNLRVSNCVMCN